MYIENADDMYVLPGHANGLVKKVKEQFWFFRTIAGNKKFFRTFTDTFFKTFIGSFLITLISKFFWTKGKLHFLARSSRKIKTLANGH